MTAHVGWTQQKVDALSATAAAKLRSDLANQSMSADAGERRSAFGLLRMLDGRRDGARSVEERAAGAKAFLYGERDPAVADRAWAMAVELCGSEREAERRGHRRPA